MSSHMIRGRQLSRDTEHRKALRRNLVQSLFEHGAILVNKEGKRFCDERVSPALALADQPDKFGYILIDGRLAEQFSAWPHFVSTAPGIAYAYVPDYRRNRHQPNTEDKP